MIIQYYADSLGLTRPGIVALNERYIYLLEKWLRESVEEEVFIINRARGGNTIDKLYEIFKEDEGYIEGEKDFLIIHEGICDCAPRPVSGTLRNLISKLPIYLRNKIIGYLHKNRARILSKKSGHFLVGKVRYEQILEEWLRKALPNFNRIYLFNIAPTNKEMEAHSPGFGASIQSYNAIMEKVVTKINNSKIKIFDVYTIITRDPCIDDLIVKEDGHHITAAAHKIYAEQLIESIKHDLMATC